jgi:pyroglutamyl-peptidase
VTTVLLSGFEPFDRAATNSSWDAVQRLAAEWQGAASLVTELLPVEFGTAWQRLDAAIARHSPDIIIAVGLADGRTAITPERIAINLADARIPDNAGTQPRDLPVVEQGPAAYFSGLPVPEIVDAIRAEGIAAEMSLSAGAYVCNDLMYRLLHEVHRDRPGLVAGFIHVPSADAMPIATIARGLGAAVEATLARSAAQSLANQGG